MTLVYGYLKGTVASDPGLKSTRLKHETQYHLHLSIRIDESSDAWDTAINVGTNDADDLLCYKIAYDFHHPIMSQLAASPGGFSDLTGSSQLPALDFLRSDVLKETGDWRPSDPIDGSAQVEPVASLTRLMRKARDNQYPVYIFGRKYTDGNGVHDVHMNQGSSGKFINNGVDDHNDHNDVWQDGAVLVDMGNGDVAAYLTAFTQQLVPTNGLGNPKPNGHTITAADDGSLH
jgi:uncharacterized protein YukJ